MKLAATACALYSSLRRRFFLASEQSGPRHRGDAVRQHTEILQVPRRDRRCPYSRGTHRHVGSSCDTGLCVQIWMSEFGVCESDSCPNRERFIAVRKCILNFSGARKSCCCSFSSAILSQFKLWARFWLALSRFWLALLCSCVAFGLRCLAFGLCCLALGSMLPRSGSCLARIASLFDRCCLPLVSRLARFAWLWLAFASLLPCSCVLSVFSVCSLCVFCVFALTLPLPLPPTSYHNVRGTYRNVRGVMCM